MYNFNEMSKRDLISDKIQLLRDFKILLPNYKKQEAMMCNILTLCKTEMRMEHKIPNVLYNNETLKELIQREGIEMCKSENAYTFGDDWKILYFEKDKIMKEFNSRMPNEIIKYNKIIEAFVHHVNGEKLIICRGRNYLTREGIKHLYEISIEN